MKKEIISILCVCVISFCVRASNQNFNEVEKENLQKLEDKFQQNIKKAQNFIDWLEENKNNFASCKPKLIKNNKLNENFIELCDGTQADFKLIKTLFAMSPKSLVEFIRKEKINLEIMCKSENENVFKDWCSTKYNRSFFKEVTSLHGQYIPEENTIALNSDSHVGSLIHEYFHYLQYINTNQKFGRIYKNERIEIQNELAVNFDLLISKIRQLEKEKKIEDIKKLLPYANQFSGLLMKFGFWQKLIDERNIFLTFKIFENELKVQKKDIDLALKNIGFLCADKELSPLLAKDECNN